MQLIDLKIYNGNRKNTLNTVLWVIKVEMKYKTVISFQNLTNKNLGIF